MGNEIKHDIICTWGVLRLRVYFPYSQIEEFFTDGLKGRKWGIVKGPIILADVINKDNQSQFTLERKEFADHIKIDISDALNILEVKAKYYVNYQYPAYDSYCLMMKEHNIEGLNRLFKLLGK